MVPGDVVTHTQTFDFRAPARTSTGAIRFTAGARRSHRLRQRSERPRTALTRSTSCRRHRADRVTPGPTTNCWNFTSSGLRRRRRPPSPTRSTPTTSGPCRPPSRDHHQLEIHDHPDDERLLMPSHEVQDPAHRRRGRRPPRRGRHHGVDARVLDGARSPLVGDGITAGQIELPRDHRTRHPSRSTRQPTTTDTVELTVTDTSLGKNMAQRITPQRRPRSGRHCGAAHHGELDHAPALRKGQSISAPSGQSTTCVVRDRRPQHNTVDVSRERDTYQPPDARCNSSRLARGQPRRSRFR